MCKTFLHGYTVKKKDLFDNNSIISATAKSYISISYQKDLFSKDTRIFTASSRLSRSKEEFKVFKAVPRASPNAVRIVILLKR